ncbi:methyltransferase family protein [Acaryochloris marina NIES-2412]|uniref:methyltransferase family protein n=1 Tax=Acaryochloris marina TaxID=155978 RepID=UPI0040580FD9
MNVPAYGLWSLVIINSLVFIIFAFSFTKPNSPRDWRSFGAFSAFIVALFTEMYGFPLTIYLLSGWLQSRFPQLDIFSHESGHLWHTLLGWEGNPHLDPLHILSNVLIVVGFILIASAWRILYAAQQRHQLAVNGLYARVRHPQYDGFVLIMLGFLLQWPTILTLLMFPVLVWMYTRLALQEDREMHHEFGEDYLRYAVRTPVFIPHLRKKAQRG